MLIQHGWLVQDQHHQASHLYLYLTADITWVARSCANTGVVSLGASQTTGTYLLPRLIAIFRQRNPQVVVQLQARAAPLCTFTPEP